MNTQCLTQFGLMLDILGVVLLFLATTHRRIEAELSYGLLKGTIDRMTKTISDPETGETITVLMEPDPQTDEVVRQLPVIGRRVRRNHIRARVGLGLIVLGFIIQLVGTFSF